MRFHFLLCSLWSMGLWAQVVQPEHLQNNPPLPRYLTQAERLQLLNQPLVARGSAQTPTGPIHCPAEYEPMAGILVSYQGAAGWLDILDQMAAHITTTGNADLYVMADSNSEVATIRANMAAAGADMNRVKVEVVATDSIWMRDYGPRYIYEGNCRAIVDHTYNRPRPNDNRLPSFFANLKNHRRYQIPLVHGGGNYHLQATGLAFTTRLINNENPGLSEAEIYDLWASYQNVDTKFYQAFPLLVDATQHIDMWMQAIGDQEVVISDWPFNSGSVQDQICDGVASELSSQGFTVHRVPARSIAGTHYTYTNVVMCNDIVLIPSYTRSQVVQHNSQAQAAWEAALPGKTIIPINCQAIVTAAGVMHCIVMHLPAPMGGINPTVHIRNEPGGQIYAAGTDIVLDFLTDDDEEVTQIEVLLSQDGGQSFTTVASNLPPTSPLSVTLPNTTSFQARLRIQARDQPGNTGFDQHDLDFTINGPRSCPEDCAPNQGNGVFGDGVVNQSDLAAVIENWGAGFGPYDVSPLVGNQIYGDFRVDVLDAISVINAFGSCN